jgi:hypothetical protein
LVEGGAVNGERSESAGREAPLTAGTKTKHSQPGEAETPTIDQRKPVPNHRRREDDHGEVVAQPGEAAEVLGVGRSRLYDLMRTRELA